MKGNIESVISIIESDSKQPQIQSKRRQIRRQYGQQKYSKNDSISSRIKTQYQRSPIASSLYKRMQTNKAKISNSDNNQLQNQSVFINRIANKYGLPDSSLIRIKDQMELIIDKKTSEIEALRVHRDQLKFISCNNPYNKPIKISLGLLKEKAKTQQKVRHFLYLLQKDIRIFESQFNIMSQYYNFISNTLRRSNQCNLIIDSHEEEMLMIQNLQKETNFLFRELKEQDKRNAKDIKFMQDQIYQLRISIKQKQDRIRDLKAKICCFHMKLHGKGSMSKEKTLSLSNRKNLLEQLPTINQIYIGNNINKHKSRQIIQKLTSNEQLTQWIFYYDQKRQNLSFKCIFSNSNTKLHCSEQGINEKDNNYQLIFKKDKEKKQILQTCVQIKQLLSIKVYYKSKIVGIQCRLKTPRGNQSLQIGNCQANLQYELLTLINKRISTIGSYWYQNTLIGIGLWYTNKLRPKSKLSTQGRQLSSKNSRETSNKKGSMYSPSYLTRKISKSQYYNYD